MEEKVRYKVNVYYHQFKTIKKTRSGQKWDTPRIKPEYTKIAPHIFSIVWLNSEGVAFVPPFIRI